MQKFFSKYMVNFGMPKVVIVIFDVSIYVSRASFDKITCCISINPLATASSNQQQSSCYLLAGLNDRISVGIKFYKTVF